jgi:hypothetical protein
MPRLLAAQTHNPTEVLEVIEALRKDDLAFYDRDKRERKVPIFGYDPETGDPDRIVRWQTRKVLPNDGALKRAELLNRCEVEGKDTYIDGIGWVRNGKKRERDANTERN